MLLWVDLETTGLDPLSEVILELAAIVTDDKLVEVARYHAVTNAARSKIFHELDPVVQDMHHKNGLWMESLRSNLPVKGMCDRTLDREFWEFVDKHAVVLNADGKRVLPQLAGSTISFDRSFMEHHLTKSAKLFHYRNVDVTSFNELSRRFATELHDARPRQAGTAHRAMADIENSLEVGRHYANHLASNPFRPPAPPPAAEDSCRSNLLVTF